MRSSGATVALAACAIFTLAGRADTVTYGQLTKAADSGNYRAQRELGKAFYLGTEGVPRDYDKAFAYLLRAAAQEDPVGEFYLARLYEKGHGVARDEAKAFFLYDRAATQGENESRCQAAKMYFEGRLTKPDPEKGFAYLLHAGDSNFAPAQLAVAQCYAKGTFVHADQVLAYKWALLASETLPEAQQALADFRRNMTPAQIDAGQLATEAWVRRAKFGAPQDDLKIAFDDNTSRMKMDFVFANGNICIPVIVQNRGAVYMIVDTGAEETIIDSDVAPELGIHANDYSSLAAFGDDMAMGADVGGVQIKLKSMTLSNMRVMVTSLLSAVSAFSNPHPFGNDTRLGGIIGSDVLSHFVVHINYADSTIEFILPRDFQYDRSAEALPLTFHGQIPLVEASVTNGARQSKPTRFILDTGNGGALTLTLLFSNDYPDLNLRAALFSGVYGLGGPSPAAVGKCSSLVIGTNDVPKPVFHYAQPRSDTWSAGTIGNDVWRRFDLTIDFPDSEIYFKKISDFALAQPFRCNLFGLIIKKLQDTPPLYSITKVWDGSAALRAGLKFGDEVTTVDGVSISNISDNELLAVLEQEGTLRLSILRNGVASGVVLKSSALPEPIEEPAPSPSTAKSGT